MNFKNAVNLIKQNNLNVHYFGYFKNNTTSIHNFKKDTSKKDVRSISKTVLTLITGIIIETTDLSLESEVYPIIKDHINLKNTNNIEMLKKVKIKHCLNHTLGFDKVLMMRDDIKDLKNNDFLNYIVNEKIVYEPGTFYLYSNAGFYLLSAVLQIYLEEDLNSFAKKHFFDRLNIHNYTWEKYGPYLAGATRLWLYPNDLMQIGKLLLNNGIFDEHQLVSKSWIDYMKQKSFETPKQDTPNRLFRRYAYANGMWIAKEKDIFFAHGTDSQMLVISPKDKKIILAQSIHSNLEDVEIIINDLLEN